MRKPFGAMAVLLLAVLAAPRLTRADSAADKATAREVATEGIGLYRAGKYADALDRLRRAQALYDAPVHLLYIARSEEKLGQLVESSETYRTLDRYTLPADAPEAWVAAVDDGRKELALLEPRLPKLRIRMMPKDAPEPTVEIDGASVSPAVIGIARAVNPGTHHVVVAAKGYERAESDVETKEGATEDVALTLPAAKTENSDAPVASGGAPKTGDERALVGFLAGLRLGAGIPAGTISHERVTDHDTSLSDAAKPGGSLEIHAGVRIGRFFTPTLYFEGESLGTGGKVLKQTVKSAGAASLGLGVLIGTPPGKMGGFGEFDLVVLNQLTLSSADAANKCDLTARGAALRFGGGAVFPLSNWLQLTPFAMATVGRFTKLDASGTGCLARTDVKTISTDDVRTHYMIVLGVGGDVLFGPNR